MFTKSFIALSLLAVSSLASQIPAPKAERPSDAQAFLKKQGKDAELFVGNENKRQWWVDSRFGVFMHWNPSSIEGTSISWGRGGLRPHHSSKENKKGVPAERYDNLYKEFNPVKFDADAWIKMVKESGAKYFVFTSKHHDGFCMFETKHTDYNIMNTPFKRDICKELAEACEKYGIKLFFYYSQPDWNHADYKKKDLTDYNKFLHAQIAELLDYPALAGIWWDGLGKHIDNWNGTELVKMIKAKRPDILMNPRFATRKWRFGDYDTPEQEIGGFQIDRPWETCLTMGQKWSHVHNTKQVLPFEVCMRSLIRCAGGDGNLLLNVGPTPEGTIRQVEQDNYRRMGQWLKKYGESIYATRGGPYKPAHWGMSTRTEKAIYLHVLQHWPDGVLEIADPGLKVLKAEALTGGDLRFSQKDGKLILNLDASSHDPANTLIKLTTEGSPLTLEVIEAEQTGKALNRQAGVTITPSSESDRGPASVLIKGGKEFVSGAHHRKAWTGLHSDKKPFLEIDLGSIKIFSKVAIEERMAWTDMCRGFFLEYQAPDGSWKEITKGDYLGYFTVDFKPVTAQKVRVRFVNHERPTAVMSFDIFE
ncbi:alpha-L-fucosidase precursor [Lentisphaera araneosa HTCC2155]|uniref:alpha-L-fucosidase n=1 Tax=Lentisphaera araneosa HTCC2155 TaxID=313628 RepID=A6DKM7_9BACT|nr:alpha-L-fucosidase [Lentisphaera araneosa]EDM27925.1 alpha-L-fucosidase precursor [Lentisphaera araneosa HTCC2155]